MENNDDYQEELAPITWDIRREGRAWTAEEFPARADRLIGKKLEIAQGKLFWNEETRHLLLGLLLENVGINTALKLGDIRLWKEAIKEIK